MLDTVLRALYIISILFNSPTWKVFEALRGKLSQLSKAANQWGRDLNPVFFNSKPLSIILLYL